MRKIRTGSARFEDVYRAVSEYRSQYPDKAVIYAASKHPEMGWAALMAGGSCAAIPITDATFLRSIASMTPQKIENGYLLEGADARLYYKQTADAQNITLPTKDTYLLYQVNEKTGVISLLKKIKGTFQLEGRGLFWLCKK